MFNPGFILLGKTKVDDTSHDGQRSFRERSRGVSENIPSVLGVKVSLTGFIREIYTSLKYNHKKIPTIVLFV